MISDHRVHPDHPVIVEARRRAARARPDGQGTDRNTRLGLVIEGGGMRGVMSAGALIAMERLGLMPVFDEVHAESAGALNACYFLGGQAALGARIYLEDLTSLRFMNPMRWGKILDIDFLVDHVMTGVKPLPIASVMRARPRLYVSLTNVNDGTGRVVDVKKESVPLLTLLKATAAVIPLYNRSVLLEGVPYADGGITIPIPVRNALRNGCTHVLVLLTRPADFVARPPRGLQRQILKRMLRRWDRRFVDAFFNTRHRRYNEERALAFGAPAPRPGVEIAVICPTPATPPVSRITISRRRLKASMEDSIERTTALFRSSA
jgi:predicted patatin/cPLA2 family phospholipase